MDRFNLKLWQVSSQWIQDERSTLSNMVKIKSDIKKRLFLIIVVIFNYYCDARETNNTVFDYLEFNQIKDAFFNVNWTTELNHTKLSSIDKQCIFELTKIGTGLVKGELWAMKSKLLLYINFFLKRLIRHLWFNFSFRCLGKIPFRHFRRKHAITWIIFWVFSNWTRRNGVRK